eukprot:SAG31_NODE_10300_length_1158_cov_1.167139_1_plen_53_part_10
MGVRVAGAQAADAWTARVVADGTAAEKKMAAELVEDCLDVLEPEPGNESDEPC